MDGGAGTACLVVSLTVSFPQCGPGKIKNYEFCTLHVFPSVRPPSQPQGAVLLSAHSTELQSLFLSIKVFNRCAKDTFLPT